jgi:fibronectin-binding autotransporter adhesin
LTAENFSSIPKEIMQFKCFIYFIVLPALVFSTTASWVGGTSDSWDVPGNWEPAASPNGIDDVAIFSTANPAHLPVLNVDVTLGSITFNATTSYTLSTPTGGGAKTLTFNASTGNAFITVSNNSDHTIGGADLDTPAITIVKPLTISQGSSGLFTISGKITESGVQSLTKTGSGVLRLNSNTGNVYSGGTFINAGSVSVNADNQLGSGTITLGGATLKYTNSSGIIVAKNIVLTGAGIIENDVSGAVALNGILSGSGSLQKTGSGTLTLGGANTYSGGTTVSAGVLSIANDGNLGNSAGPLDLGGATLITTSSFTSSRSGSLSGSAIIDTDGNTITLSGNFGGIGSITVQGGGTLTLSGTNSYMGNTSITGDDTTLIGSTRSILGDISVGTNTLLIFEQGFNGLIDGALSGSGSLSKSGSGIIILSENSPSFTGTTTISQGALIINANMAGSPTIVASGAILGGTGSVGSTTSDGTIIPGEGPIGSLTINGSLLLNPTSTVSVEIAPLNSSRLVVTGAATLDGTLFVEVSEGFYGFNRSYTVLTSTGLTPNFSSVVSSNAEFVPSANPVGDNIVLDIIVLHPFAAFPFSNQNTQAVGNNIDELYAAGELSASFQTLISSFIGQSFDSINNALDQMHPAPYSAFTELQAEICGQLLSLFHRMPTLACNSHNPYRFWLEPFGNSLTVKSHGEQVGFQGNSGGVALGWDVQVNELVIGIGGAWNQNHLEWHRHQGKGKSNGFYGGLYTDYIRNQFYFGTAVLAGMDFYDVSRHIQFFSTNEHANSNFNALDIMAQASFAYLFGSPVAYFYPYANIDYLYFNTSNFQESNAGDLSLTVGKRTNATLRSELGLALQVLDSNRDDTLCLSPKFAIGWVNMTPLERPSFHSNFFEADIPFTTYGWDRTWNLLSLDFGLKLSGKTFSFGVEYNLEIAPDHKLFYNQHGNVQLSWSW